MGLFLTALAWFGGLALLIAGFAWLIVRIAEHEPKKRTPLTRREEEMYHRAAKIFGRMVHLQDLPSEGEGIDILSTPTTKLVAEWLADYRKEIDKT